MGILIWRIGEFFTKSPKLILPNTRARVHNIAQRGRVQRIRIKIRQLHFKTNSPTLIPVKITGYTLSINPVKLNATSTICYHCYKYSTSRKSLNKHLTSRRVLRLRLPKHTGRSLLCVCLCASACVCLRLRASASVYVCSHASPFICVHPHVCLHASVCVYVCPFVSACIYIYVVRGSVCVL